MNYMQIREMDITNGEGLGISLFVSGCDLHCKNCFNQNTWDFRAGKPWTPEIEEKFLELADRPYIKRISILGGEPLTDENVEAILNLEMKISHKFRDSKKIWLYTGRRFEDIDAPEDMNRTKVLRAMCLRFADYVVDGPYKHDLRDMNLKYRGSSNQRIIDIERTLESGEITLYE